MYGLYQIIYFSIIDILRTLISPFFLVISILIYFQYSKLCKNPIKATIVSILYGILGGIIATVSFIYLEVYLMPRDFFIILILSIILSFLDKRFICLSYSGSLISLSSLLFSYPRVDIYEIMIVVSILHIIESFLILLNGRSQSEINYFKHKNRIVGGLAFNRFWPIPFAVFIGDVFIRPITLVAILNYSDFTISKGAKRKVWKTAVELFCYSSILLVITIKTKNRFISPIFAIIGHELIMYYNSQKEKGSTPLYSEPYKGIRVLKVRSRSIASAIGIKQGDIILRINNVKIKDENDLKDIMKIKNKELAIEYFNFKKGIRRKEYRGNKKTLGIKTFPKVEY